MALGDGGHRGRHRPHPGRGADLTRQPAWTPLRRRCRELPFRVSALPDAIAAATAKWMGWTIGRATSRETGIPEGLPYLTGYAMHAAIEAGAAG